MSIYKERIVPMLPRISEHLKSGGSVSELAGILDITPAELRKCLRQSREFSAAVESSLREYRDSIDNAVEDALFRRAVGFEQPDGKFSPPDVRAAMFWLKNRRPEAWSEKDRDGAGRTVPALSDLEEEL